MKKLIPLLITILLIGCKSEQQKLHDKYEKEYAFHFDKYERFQDSCSKYSNINTDCARNLTRKYNQMSWDELDSTFKVYDKYKPLPDTTCYPIK